MMGAAIIAEHMSVCYNHREVLHDVSFTIEEGSLVSVIGPNGCGKSTLLKGLCAMLPLAKGNVSIGSTAADAFSRQELARHVSILTQSHHISGDVTVRDLVWLGRFPYRNFYSVATEKDKIYVHKALRETGLLAHADRLVKDLSGGEQQRVWLAVMLAQDTPILLLDEPTTFLDVRHQINLLHLLSRIHDDLQRTMVVVLHDLNQAIQYTDTVIVMKDGAVVQIGKTKEVITAELLQEVFGVYTEVFHRKDGTPVFVPDRVCHS